MSEDQSTTTLAPTSDVEKPTPVAAVPETRPSPGELRKYSHGFFDPEMAIRRKVVLTILARVTVLSILVMWTCLPLYWGSLWKAEHYTNKLTVRVINRDSGAIGQQVTAGLLNQTRLRYFETSTAEFVTDADVAEDIVEEGAWAAVVVQPDATSHLLAARQAGDSNYQGRSAVQVYYAQARQHTAIDSFLLPILLGDLADVVSVASESSFAQYLAENSENSTAIRLLVQAPATAANSIGFTLNNLRPYNQPEAEAMTLVGLIHLLIFAFVITMTNNAVRDAIGPYLSTRSYLIFRIVVPLTLYLIVSFFYTMVNLPFKVNFGAHYSYAGGFFLWAFAIFLGMAALGLATEFAITIIGPRFMPFFLITLIISNAAVSSLPQDLQPWIFRYGPAMPFYNLGRIIRTIIFNTKNQIAMDIGILLAWVVFSCITVTLITWLYRRKDLQQYRKETGASQAAIA